MSAGCTLANRLTEDGAEALALLYANTNGGWIVKRRLQRGERADWLLYRDSGVDSLALEVSGTIEGNPSSRLEEKKKQVAACTLPALKLAVVVGFDRPVLMAGDV